MFAAVGSIDALVTLLFFSQALKSNTLLGKFTTKGRVCLCRIIGLVVRNVVHVSIHALEGLISC